MFPDPISSLEETESKEVSKPMKRTMAEDISWDWGAVPRRSLTAAGDTQEAGSNRKIDKYSQLLQVSH